MASTPCKGAVGVGEAARVAELTAAGTDTIDLLSPDGWTALHLAAHLDRPEIVALLLDAGADPTVFSQAFECNLPLHAALAGRAEQCAELLARATPHLDVRVGEGFTALMEAAYQGLEREGAHTEVVALLEAGPPG